MFFFFLNIFIFELHITMIENWERKLFLELFKLHFQNAFVSY